MLHSFAACRASRYSQTARLLSTAHSILPVMHFDLHGTLSAVPCRFVVLRELPALLHGTQALLMGTELTCSPVRTIISDLLPVWLAWHLQSKRRTAP